MNQSELAAFLGSGAKSLGVPLSDLQIDQFMTYMLELKKWNRLINLTAIIRDEEIIEKHFLDSLAGLKAIEDRPGQTLLDIGSGAGFPGVPLKIGLPSLKADLLESSQKKGAFLHHVVGILKLPEVAILNRRIESLIQADQRYDLIVTRAFAKIQITLEKAQPLLATHGKLILYQGRMLSPVPVNDMKGWEATIKYDLPFSKIQRRLEIFGSPS